MQERCGHAGILDAADHRCLAELVRRRKELDVDKLKQEIIRRDSPTVCNEIYTAKLNRIIFVKDPKHAANLTKSSSG